MRKRRKLVWAASGIVLSTFLYFSWKLTARSAYESAEYTVIDADDTCEVREYPDLMLASTPMAGASQGDDGSFMRLFGFISGGNENEQTIAMTVPVFMEQKSDAADIRMGFVVPKDVTESGIPEPTHEQVRISKRTGGRFAVIRFSGHLSETTAAEQEGLLRTWIANRGLTGTARSETAGYDPPWTPGPFRRNEVLIRLVENPKSSAKTSLSPSSLVQ